MNGADSQLLCTFSSFKTYEKEVLALAEFYSIEENRVYVLANVDCAGEAFLTFNVERCDGNFYPRTISVHRKKDYNVLYSINALNELIKRENGGNLSTQHEIAWSNYRNSLITTKDGMLKITPTKLVKIIRI
jgi:hypothetical protein